MFRGVPRKVFRRDLEGYLKKSLRGYLEVDSIVIYLRT